MSDTIIVVGAGHAGAQAVAQLREKGFDGKLLLIGNETHLPYQRPPLSKHYLNDSFDAARLYFKPAAYYQDKDIELKLKHKVSNIDPLQQRLTLENGEAYDYAHCILATGSSVRRLQVPGVQLDGIYYLRGINDADAIKAAMHKSKKIVICGGGYIGLEIAAIAQQKQLNVSVIEMAPTLLARVAPPEIAQFYQALHQQAGVTLHTEKVVTAFAGNDRVQSVICQDGTELQADMVVIGIGVTPNTELAEQAGLQINNGIAVNQYCQSSEPTIYAIGDCASHYNQRYQRQLRLESVQNALGQAKTAASNLTLKGDVPFCEYSELPWFWSDQYDLKLQIAGLHDDYDQVVLRGDIQQQKFAYFYLKQNIIEAVYAVNDPQSFMFSKGLIFGQTQINPNDLCDLNRSIKELAEV